MSPVACSHNLIAVSLGPCSGESSGRADLVDPLIGSTAITLLGSHSQSGLTQVIWSPRATYLVVTGGRDGKILYWDIRFPVKPVYSLNKESGLRSDSAYADEANAHSGPVLGLKFSSDGLHLISWGASGLTVNAASLRLWTSGPSDCENSSHFPTLRPVNFGNIVLNSESGHFSDTRSQLSMNVNFSRNGSQQTSVLPVRIDATYGSMGNLWGALSSCIFVPVKNRLLIASASKHDTSTKIITRHFAQIRACVWNERHLELYTCGADGNLLTWPILPLSCSTADDDDQF
ncbi:DNA excision repair protein isoform 2 [Schistosoma japonicum]|nr:DNA excision repair protein ERCC-8 [Schistosoma japonicum]TNN17803.1 DNA excision repair protein isoform 2 [Schistosoma japonicum]TNN17805.1 DNA excision repair protein isoform 2 [Schistosoma japonicum]